jgi:glycosyltransferase involved in cell wall biosynthesis
MPTDQVLPDVSVVIPVYRAEDCLEELYARLTASLQTISQNYEILLIEDGGGDRSWAIIQALAARDHRVRGVQLSRNFGQHYAITAGLDRARGQWTVVMDCDLQDPPEGIPLLYRKAQEGFDIVLALRGERSDPAMKRAVAWIFYRAFSYLTDVPFDGRIRNFRIMSRKVVLAVRQLREQLRFFAALVGWSGFRTATIEVRHDARAHGRTTYTYAKLLKLGVDTIVAYSDKPLRLVIRFGFAVALLAMLAGVWYLGKVIFFGSPVLGWSTLIVSLYFLSGLILITLGLNGLYLGKVFNETKKRPLYLISETTGGEGDE